METSGTNASNIRFSSTFRSPYAKSDIDHQSGVKLANFGRLLHQRGYISGTDGNLSVRLGLDKVLVTPRGICKGFMRSEDMVLVGLDGGKLAGHREPSSEIGLHLIIYKSRPDIAAVVHAHPCIATGFASAGIGLVEPICSELVLTLRGVPLARYAPPGSDELAHSLEPFIHDHNAILMQNHGVITYGETLEQAYLNMETVEHCARILLVTKILGRSTLLSDYEVKQLLDSTVHHRLENSIAGI